MKATTFQNELVKLTRRELVQVALELYQYLSQEEQASFTCSTLLRMAIPDLPQVVDSAETLLHQIQYFATQVRQRYYYYPNAAVSPTEQEHWSTPVRQWLEWLTQKAPFALDAPTKALALEELYRVFCAASDAAYFKGEEVFVALNCSQTTFYQLILQHWATTTNSTTLLQKGLDLLLYNAVNLSTLYADLMDVYLQVLGAERWQQALNHAQQLLWQHDLDVAKQARNLGNHLFHSKAEGRQVAIHNNLVELIFRLYAHLGHPKTAAQFFQQHYCAPTQEVRLYVLIGLLIGFDQSDLTQEYLEEAVAQPIPLRPSLQALVNRRAV